MVEYREQEIKADVKSQLLRSVVRTYQVLERVPEQALKVVRKDFCPITQDVEQMRNPGGVTTDELRRQLCDFHLLPIEGFSAAAADTKQFKMHGVLPKDQGLRLGIKCVELVPITHPSTIIHLYLNRLFLAETTDVLFTGRS